MMEDFKRPNHSDFQVSSELKAKEFTGIRHNSITNQAEIWVLGNLEKTVSYEEVQLNPLAINQAMEEVFAVHEVMPNTTAARAYIDNRSKYDS